MSIKAEITRQQDTLLMDNGVLLKMKTGGVFTIALPGFSIFDFVPSVKAGDIVPDGFMALQAQIAIF